MAAQSDLAHRPDAAAVRSPPRSPTQAFGRDPGFAAGAQTANPPQRHRMVPTIRGAAHRASRPLCNWRKVLQPAEAVVEISFPGCGEGLAAEDFHIFRSWSIFVRSLAPSVSADDPRRSSFVGSLAGPLDRRGLHKREPAFTAAVLVHNRLRSVPRRGNRHPQHLVSAASTRSPLISSFATIAVEPSRNFGVCIRNSPPPDR